jgi:hypothetical protein
MNTFITLLTIIISYAAVYFLQNTIPTYIGVTVFLSVAIPICLNGDNEVDNDHFFNELEKEKKNND